MCIKNIYSNLTVKQASNCFIQNIFAAKAYGNGGIMKRSISSVNRWSSESALIDAANAHGMIVNKTSRYYILIPVDEMVIRLNGDTTHQLNWLCASSYSGTAQGKAEKMG
jgi:hypothetical protein